LVPFNCAAVVEGKRKRAAIATAIVIEKQRSWTFVMYGFSRVDSLAVPKGKKTAKSAIGRLAGQRTAMCLEDAARSHNIL
jgi:hypothetical protein